MGERMRVSERVGLRVRVRVRVASPKAKGRRSG